MYLPFMINDDEMRFIYRFILLLNYYIVLILYYTILYCTVLYWKRQNKKLVTGVTGDNQ